MAVDGSFSVNPAVDHGLADSLAQALADFRANRTQMGDHAPV
jgi:hypothetical protein